MTSKAGKMTDKHAGKRTKWVGRKGWRKKRSAEVRGVGKRRKRKPTRRKESEKREECRQTSPEEGDR